MTDEGLGALARAIEDTGKRGLPMLTKFEACRLQGITNKGVATLGFALIKNFPRLKKLDLYGRMPEMD